jgi:FKBP-type peptidyl-prolyl cis-trans isomerase
VLAASCGDDDAASSKTPATTGTSAITTASKTATAAASSAPKTATTAAATGTPIVLASPTVLPDGLKYVDVVVGTGATPTMASTVTVNYTGRLASNGKVFDTTSGKAPATFPMQGVIKGFSEAILTMKVGGKRTVFIPAALGYGAQANGPIPANSDLVFDIELVAVK